MPSAPEFDTSSTSANTNHAIGHGLTQTSSLGANHSFTQANLAIAETLESAIVDPKTASSAKAEKSSAPLTIRQRQQLIGHSLDNQSLQENRSFNFVISPKQIASLRLGQSYSQARRKALEKLTCNEAEKRVAGYFGHRVAASLHFSNYLPATTLPTQICSTEHKYSTAYQRDFYGKIKPLMEKILQSSHIQKQVQHHRNGEKMAVRLTGAVGVAERFNTFFKHLVPPGRTGARQFSISDGVEALLLPDSNGLRANQPVLDGSSAIDNAYHFLSGPPALKALSEVDLNTAELEALPQNHTGSLLKRQLQPSLDALSKTIPLMDSGSALVSEIALRLAREIIPAIHDMGNLQAGQDIARQIANLLTAMANSPLNFGICCELMDCLYDEISTLLSLANPYSEDQAHRLQEKIYLDSLPCLQGTDGIRINSEAFTGSGMQAISTSLGYLVNRHRQLGLSKSINMLSDLKLNYYEAEHLASKLASSSPGNIIYSTLNPSSWTAKIDHEMIINAVNQSLQLGVSTGLPVYLVLDTTVDTGRNELNQIIDRLTPQLGAGKLAILLCRSYQKYASLGSGKIAMGNLTSIQSELLPGLSFGTDVAQGSSSAFRDNNGQLLTHFLKSHELSIKVIQAAADNAQFVGNYCWPLTSREPIQYRAHAYRNLGVVTNLPFVFRRSLPDNEAELLLTTQNVQARMTFGFLESSTCGIGSMVRLSTGIESKKRLVEKFFAMGHSIGQAPLDQSAFDALTIINSPEAGRLLSIPSETLEQALAMPNLHQIIVAAEEAYLTAPQVNMVSVALKQFRQPIGTTFANLARFIRQYDANIRASIVLFNASMVDLYPNRFRSIKSLVLHECAKLVRDQYKGRSPGAEDLSPEATQGILKRFLTHVAQNFRFEASDQGDRSKIIDLLKITHASTRLDLMGDSFPDSVFGSPGSENEAKFQSELLEALNRGVQYDVLADTARLRLMKHSRNRSLPAGINLASAIFRRLESIKNEPALTVDFQQEDLTTATPSLKERDLTALDQLGSAIKLHDQLEARKREAAARIQ